MVRFLIERPIAVVATLIAFVALGIVSAIRMPVSLLPNIDIPEISVRISCPDVGARQLENSVVVPLRHNLLQMRGLVDVESETRDAGAMIHLEFDHGTNIHYAFIEANEKIDAMTAMFPRNMPRPTVLKKAASDIPVFYLNIAYKDGLSQNYSSLTELSNYVENVVKRRIEQLGEVSMVDINGLVRTVIRILPNKSKMLSLGISNDDLHEMLSKNNADHGSLLFKDGQYRYQVRFTSKLRTAGDIGNIYLKKDNRLLQIKDIADVEMLPAEPEGHNIYNDADGISLAIYKQSGARMEMVREKMLEIINELEQDNPGITFELGRDQSELLSYSLNNLKQTLLLGMVLAVTVMFFVMRNRKLPWLIAVSIPASLIISLFFMNMFSVSINIISLSGLILGVGMMIDNSIIVIDNINQYRQQKHSIDEACVAGTNEVIRPLISSVLTTCAVFVPLVFLSGIAGALFFDQALAVAISLLASLFISIMVLPVLFRLVHGKNAWHVQSPESKMKIEVLYEKGLLAVLNRKALFLALFFMLVPIGLILFYFVDKQIFPDIEETETLMSLEWNEPVNIGESRKRIVQLIKTLDTPFETGTVIIGKPQFVLTGTADQSETEATFYFSTSNVGCLNRLKNEMTNKFARLFPGAIIKFMPADNIFHEMFNNGNAPLVAKIRLGATGKKNEEAYANIANSISRFAGDGAKKHVPIVKTSYIVNVNFEQLLLYGVDYRQLLSKLKALLSRYKIGSLSTNNKFTDIIIVSEKAALGTLIGNGQIRNKNNKLIPLNALVSISQQPVLKVIKADRLGEYFPVDIDAGYWDYKKTMSITSNRYKNDSSFSLSWDGSIFDGIDLFREFLFVLLVSVLLLYFILAAQFESLVQPVIVLLEVIFDISGALFMLFVFGSSLNVMSAIGIVVMGGIVINDSILKIDSINRLFRSGVSLKEAIIRGGGRRFKPIVMTSITTILALVPMLLLTGMGVELQLPLALAVIGGLFVGTFVSLYFIPVFYLLIYGKKEN